MDDQLHRDSHGSYIVRPQYDDRRGGAGRSALIAVLLVVLFVLGALATGQSTGREDAGSGSPPAPQPATAN